MKRLFYFLLPVCLAASSYEAPWLGTPFAFEGELTGGLSYAKSIQTDTGQITYHDSQKHLLGSLAFNLPTWQFVLAASAARTAKESFNLTCGTFLVRYNILNDVDGSSPFSLTAGFRGDFPKKRAISDPGLIYSYYCQGEAELSVGKEWICGPYWQWHLWFLGALGSATRYSPWIRGKVGLERNFQDTHQLGLFIAGQDGFGQSSFPLLASFQSYGPLAYRFVDLSLRYGYQFWYIGSLAVEYTLRLAATNCPANKQAIALTINIPFSLV